MLDANQQQTLATWVNKNSKRLNDSVAKARSQSDFRTVLADATAYLNQLRSERDTHTRALDDTLQLLEQRPASQQQGETWARTEMELRRDVELRQQIIFEFDRHIIACEALIAWVQGQITPVQTDAATPTLVPPATSQSHPSSNLRRLLIIAAGILGVLLAVWLLLPLVRGSQSASEKPSATATVQAATSGSGQARTPGVVTPARQQATPSSASGSPATPIRVAAAAETAQATGVSPRVSENPTAQPAPTRTLSPVPTATLAPSATETPAATPTSSATKTPAATPTSTRTREPSPTAVSTATATLAATPRVTTPVVSTATPVPRRPSPVPLSPSVPIPLEPRADETRRGDVTFVWQTGGPLPPGAAYEVVWWNSGEDPAGARGIAATTTETSLTANLDPLYSSAQLRSTDFYWTVIVVQTSPYVRLTQPAQSASRHLNYAAPSQQPPSKP